MGRRDRKGTRQAVKPQPENTAAIPADLAKAALRKDSSNLLKKVAAGKTLTKSEREVLSKASVEEANPKPESLPKRAASMKAAASMLNFPMTWISIAKASGCAGFNAKGSVLLKPVRDWILENQTKLESTADQLPLREQKLAEEVRRLRIRNDKDAGKLVEVAYIEHQDAACCSNWHAARIKVEQEWPPRLAGKDIPECRTILRELTSEIGRILKTIRGS